MRTTKRITKKVYKTRRGAIRTVPPIVEEWAEDTANDISDAFDSVENSWLSEVLTPNGEPEWAPGGFAAKTDGELQRIELHLIAVLAADFESGDCRVDMVFRLRSYIEELTAMTDELECPSGDIDDECDE